MRFNKTQRELLEQAAGNCYGRVSVVTGHYSTRRNSTYGTRKLDAAQALIAHGLLVRFGDAYVTRDPIRGPRGGSIGTHYGRDYSYEITDAGRAALAQPMSIATAIRRLSAAQKFCE